LSYGSAIFTHADLVRPHHGAAISGAAVKSMAPQNFDWH